MQVNNEEISTTAVTEDVVSPATCCGLVTDSPSGEMKYHHVNCSALKQIKFFIICKLFILIALEIILALCFIV